MTVALAIVAPDGSIHMAADGRATAGDSMFPQARKLWTHLDGRMGMATAGPGRLGQELRSVWKPPPIDYLTGDDYLLEVAGSIEAHLHASEHLWAVVAREDETQHFDGAVLVAHAGRVVWIGGDFCVNEVDPDRPYIALGTGGEVATGSLDATHELGVEIGQRIDLALAAAAREVISVGPPFVKLTVPA